MQVISKEKSNHFANSDIWLVRSENVGDVFRVCVTAPGLPIPPGHRMGAVYGLDGDLVGGIDIGVLLGGLMGNDLPPLYSVSIAYPLDTPVPALVQRMRDYTPTPCPRFDGIYAGMYGISNPPASGGGDAFGRFLIDELRPALAEAYPIDPDDATLTGTSAGGLFGLYMLLERPGAFKRIMACNPAVWWDGRMMFDKLLSAPTSLTNAVYISAGEFESAENIAKVRADAPEAMRAIHDQIIAITGEIDMIKDGRDYAAMLKGRMPGLQVSYTTHLLETHSLNYAVSMSHGLRMLFGTLPFA